MAFKSLGPALTAVARGAPRARHVSHNIGDVSAAADADFESVARTIPVAVRVVRIGAGSEDLVAVADTVKVGVGVVRVGAVDIDLVGIGDTVGVLVLDSQVISLAIGELPANLSTGVGIRVDVEVPPAGENRVDLSLRDGRP